MTFSDTILIDDQLQTFLHHIQETNRLTCLKLSNISTLSENFVQHGFAETTLEDSMTSIKLVNVRNASNLTLRHISRHLPKLKTIVVSNCRRVSDEGVINISKSCPSLTHVEFSSLGKLTDHTLVRMATSLPSITYLDVSDNANLSDVGICELLTILRGTKSLLMSNLPLITDASLRLLHEYPVVYGYRPHSNFSKLEVRASEERSDKPRRRFNAEKAL